ncbi:MAG: hypothetical protein AB8C13_07455 [Phycisphaerales bacterium]
MTKFQHQSSSPTSFRSKLSSYVTGLAIGFCLLGFFMYQKHRSEQRHAQKNQQSTQQLLDQLNDSEGQQP